MSREQGHARPEVAKLRNPRDLPQIKRALVSPCHEDDMSPAEPLLRMRSRLCFSFLSNLPPIDTPHLSMSA